MRTSQLNQTTMIKAMNTLSQNAWPFWNGPPIRSLSNPGSRHANLSVTARPPITNSAKKIQAPGQSSVPADKNSSAPMDTIHNEALMQSPHLTLGLLSNGWVSSKIICPLWVISGHQSANWPCPLHPESRHPGFSNRGACSAKAQAADATKASISKECRPCTDRVAHVLITERVGK